MVPYCSTSSTSSHNTMHRCDWLSVKLKAYCILLCGLSLEPARCLQFGCVYRCFGVLTHVDPACPWSIGQTALRLSERSMISLRLSIAHSAFSSIAVWILYGSVMEESILSSSFCLVYSILDGQHRLGFGKI